MANSLLFTSLLILHFLTAIYPRWSTAISPAVFIFGDSILDVGTNNFVPNSTAVSNFPHNGIDFVNSTPTGRFSNGLNTADFLAKLSLGAYATSPLPFLSLRTTKPVVQQSILTGVNFASGGAGLLDATGQRSGVVSFSEQIKHFATVRDNLTRMIGPVASQWRLSKSMFFFSAGGNDLMDYMSNKKNTSSNDFISALSDAYENHIMALYNQGARKFGILNVAPIGCIPYLRVKNTSGCFEDANTLTKAFNYELNALLTKIAYQLPEIKYALGNTYEVITSFIKNPEFFGFKNVKSACCGSGKLNAKNGCTPKRKFCSNRDEYLFWDRIHPTQVASKLSTEILSNGGPRFVAPINFALLEKL